MRRNFISVGFLVALLGGSGQALSAQQQVAGDLLRSVGAVPGACRTIIPARDYAALASDDQAGRLVCGQYTSSVSKARLACQANAGPTTPINWTSRRNHLQGTFKKNGYLYTITMTCRGNEFMVRISKLKA